MTSVSSRRIWRFGTGIALVLGLIGAGMLLSRSATGSIPAPLPLPSPNGFDRYVAAATAIVPARPPVDAVNDTVVLTPAQAAVNYAPARREAWIGANARAWALMASAKAVASRHPNMRGTTMTLPAWKRLRELARSQSIRVHNWEARGQWGAAMDGGLDTLQMGRDIEHGAPLIGSLVGMAIEHIADRCVEDVPAHLSALEARAATRRLETIIATGEPFSGVLTEEKWSFLTLALSSMGGTSARGAFASLVTTPGRTGYIRTMDAFIAGANAPALAQKPVPLPAAAPGFLGIYNLMYPSVEEALFSEHRRRAVENLLLLRLALRAYRVQNGAYPAQLSALAPGILKQLPVDPFGAGEPLRYRVAGDSYLAWSIGPDGIDNGGALIPLRPGATHRVARATSQGDITASP